MEQITPRQKGFIVFKVCGAVQFQIFGFIGFFISIWKGNWSCAGACVMLEICIFLVLLFSKHHMNGQLHLKYSASRFRVMTYVAAVFVLCSFGAGIAFILAGSKRKETFNVYSYYAAAMIAFMAGFWSIVLFFDCRKYLHLLEGQ